MKITTTMLPVGDWRLAVRRHVLPAALDRRRRPLVMVPGYAMNTWILGHHPRGRSMIDHLAAAGVDVWTADLRGQGDARRVGSRPPGARSTHGIGELALDDLPAVLDHVRQHSGQDRVDVMGCSLGGSLVYAFLAHHPDDHGIGAVVAIGAPLRWTHVHPALKLAFASPTLVGLVPIRGTRAIARRLLPILRHAPGLLSIYMNAGQIDLSRVDQLVQTIDDPVPGINRQIARWVRQGDLVVRGVHVPDALRQLAGRGTAPPVLAVVANRDGIVPASAARSIEAVLGPERVTTLQVGDDERWYAHADLFVGDHAEQAVFHPIERWLANQSRRPPQPA